MTYSTRHLLHAACFPLSCFPFCQNLLLARLKTIFFFLQPNEDAAFRRLQDVVEYQVTQGKMAMPTKLLLRFACDGAKIGKKRNSVRGCVKVMTDRDRLPETEGHISITPDDELTLFFFLGMYTHRNVSNI